MHKSAAYLVGCLVLAAVSSTAAQQHGPTSCSTHITSCGCVITHANTYVVDDDLNANQTTAPNCIEIAASGTKLNLMSHSVSGNGHGIGILIRQGADNVIVQGATNTGSFRMAEEDSCDLTAQAIVNGWNIGIEDDGNYAMIELFDQLGGIAGPNAMAGILMNGVTGSVASDFIACGNGVAGVIVRNSSGVSVTNYTSDGNNPEGEPTSQTGTWLDNSHDCSLGTATNVNNTSYGYWVMRSSRNIISDANATSANGDTGILIGCGTVHCTGNETSDNNRITNAGATGNGNNGIEIQLHNHRNMIANTSNGGNSGTDMIDLNPNCDSNNWYNNTGTKGQDCIQ